MTTETQLPQGWKKYNLFDICQPKQWKTIAVKDLTNEGYPVYGANGIIGFHNEFNHERETLLIGCRGSCGEIHISKPKSYINGNAMCLDNLSDNILLHYLYYFLKGYNFKPIISGSTQPQITQIGLRKVEITIPPLETQQTIVNKIESLFAEIDAGIASLKNAQQQLVQYRQALLKNAFNGELTKAWREQNAETLPSAEELLTQIQTARQQHYTEQLKQWESAVKKWELSGKEGKKPSKPKALTQAVKFEEDFADLPNEWGVVRFENICDLIRNGISIKPEGESGTKIFRISAVRPFQLNLDDYRFLNVDDDIDSFILKNGDLLFTRYNGTKSFVGVCAEFKSNEKYVYPDKLIRAVVNSTKINNTFLMYGFNTGFSRKFVEGKIRTTAGQSGISGSDIKAIPIVVCSLAEQTQIVAILEQKLTACDQLTTELASQLKQAELLKQAVLKAAFSGRL